MNPLQIATSLQQPQTMIQQQQTHQPHKTQKIPTSAHLIYSLAIAHFKRNYTQILYLNFLSLIYNFTKFYQLTFVKVLVKNPPPTEFDDYVMPVVSYAVWGLLVEFVKSFHKVAHNASNNSFQTTLKLFFLNKNNHLETNLLTNKPKTQNNEDIVPEQSEKQNKQNNEHSYKKTLKNNEEIVLVISDQIVTSKQFGFDLINQIFKVFFWAYWFHLLCMNYQNMPLPIAIGVSVLIIISYGYINFYNMYKTKFDSWGQKILTVKSKLVQKIQNTVKKEDDINKIEHLLLQEEEYKYHQEIWHQIYNIIAKCIKIAPIIFFYVLWKQGYQLSVAEVAKIVVQAACFKKMYHYGRYIKRGQIFVSNWVGTKKVVAHLCHLSEEIMHEQSKSEQKPKQD